VRGGPTTVSLCWGKRKQNYSGVPEGQSKAKKKVRASVRWREEKLQVRKKKEPRRSLLTRGASSLCRKGKKDSRRA